MCWIDLKQVLLTTTATTGLFCSNTVISIFFAFQFGLCHIGTVWNIGRHIYFMCTKLVYVRILFVVISSLYDALKERRSTIKNHQRLRYESPNYSIIQSNPIHHDCCCRNHRLKNPSVIRTRTKATTQKQSL